MILRKNNIDKLNTNTGVIYRKCNKKLNINKIIEVKKYCKSKRLKFYISNNFKIAMKLDLDRVTYLHLIKV